MAPGFAENLASRRITSSDRVAADRSRNINWPELCKASSANLLPVVTRGIIGAVEERKAVALRAPSSEGGSTDGCPSLHE